MSKGEIGHIRFLYHNTAGFGSFLHDDAEMKDVDIIVVGETWLSAADSWAFTIAGFKAHHCFHNRDFGAKGVPYGGVSVFVRNEFLYPYMCKDSNCRSIVWIEFPTLKLKVAAAYMAPEGSRVWARLGGIDPLVALRDGVVEGQQKGYTIAVLGDLNARIGALSDIPDDATFQQHPAEPRANVLSGVYVYDDVPKHRSCKDTGTNSRGKDFISLCMEVGMVVCNGRAGEDAGCGAFTFVPFTEKGDIGEHWGSTIDLACISANAYSQVENLMVDQIEEKGKHAMIRWNIIVHHHPRRDRGKGKKQRARNKVCRPDISQLKRYAVKHFRAREQHFDSIHTAFEKGDISATAALQQVVDSVKACVKMAERDARNDTIPSHEVEEIKGALWWDEEYKVAHDRFFTNRHKYLLAKKAVPPLSQHDLDAMSEHSRALRADLQRLGRRKRSQMKQEMQKQLIRAYFSSCPKDFWDVFKQGLRSKCELDDVDACTSYFQGLLGGKESLGQEGEGAVLGSWSPSSDDTAVLDDVDRDFLNAPLTREELCTHIKACKNGKAADLDGMTAEALKLVVASGAHSMLDCITAVIDGCDVTIPRQMTQNKLTPIPKAANSGKNLLLHRGIAVGNIFGKIGDKFRCSRFTSICERKGLRAFTQCGFRPEHGTLDAVFCLLTCGGLCESTREASCLDSMSGRF